MKAHRLGGSERPVFEVRLHEKAVAEFEALPERVQERMEAGIDRLAADPFRGRPGADILKLEDPGGAELWRPRVGSHRAIDTVAAEGLVVLVAITDERGSGYARLVAIARARLGA